METAALSFARPEWLHALWLLPLGVLLFWWAERRRRDLVGRLLAPKLRDLLAGTMSPARRVFRAACVLGALGLLFVTLAGPQLGYDSLEVPHTGRDVIIAMDVSRSMLATDIAPTRLQRAKLLAEDLVGELGGDRLGLVAFAGTAFLQAPLTLDHGAVLAAVDELDTDLIPRGGTNIAAAIRASEDAFGTAEGFSRAIVLISDGEELDADGVAAARQAAANGIRIFTVGIGSPEGSEIPLAPGEFVRDEAGQIVVTRLDVGRLTEIAEATGGFYTPLDDRTVSRLVADGIGRLDSAEFSASTQRRPIERYQWPLGAAIALLALQALVGERRRRPLVATAATLWLLSAPVSWGGLSAYESGDYEEARRVFEERLRLEPGAAELQFNAGTAAYRTGDFQSAAGYFSRAMLTDDPKLRAAAEFNLGNTLFRLGERQQDQEKRITDWQEAIAKYEAALQTRPDYTEARENKERVEELLRQAEEEEPEPEQEEESSEDQEQEQEQEQDEQQQDQDQQQDEQPCDGGEGEDDQQDQQSEDQEQDGSGDQPQDQDQQTGEDPAEGDQGEGEQDQQDGDGADGDRSEGEGQEGEQEQDGEGGPQEQDAQPGDSGDSREQPAPLPEQSGERKEGDLQSAQEGGEPPAPLEASFAEEEMEGRMSEGQARALLRALEGEEEQVDLRERPPFHDVLRDW